MLSRKISISIIALFLIALVLTLTTYGALNNGALNNGALNVSRTLSSSGSITATPNLSIYSDSACTNSLSTIDWGIITPGNAVTKTVYVKNTGTGTSLALSMSTSNWNPTSANGPVTLSWAKEGERLSPGQSTAAVITLTASSSIAGITTFSIQIIITGTA